LRIKFPDAAGRARSAADDGSGSIELARDLYGLPVTAKALPGEYDVNFHLTTPGDNPPHTKEEAAAAGFVLKVMHPARERAFIDMQCCALQHLAKRAPQLTLRACGSTEMAKHLPRLPRRMDRRGSCGCSATCRHDAGEGAAALAGTSAQPRLFLGEMDAALADFTHDAAGRELKWDLTRAGWIRAHLHLIHDASQRALVEKFLSLYEVEVLPVLPHLRRSVVYGDANDYNVLVGKALPLPRKVVSVIDFGDMHETVTVSKWRLPRRMRFWGSKIHCQRRRRWFEGITARFRLRKRS